MSLSIPTTTQSLSSLKTLRSLSSRSFPGVGKLSLASPTYRTTPIRMGGGPRTYPGGVSKWQWKRMQAKKAKQILKDRLARERRMYEMRKRGELKAAVERPWEAVEKPPNPFSGDAVERRKVLSDRDQKPDMYDLWPEMDEPELFRPDNGLPSCRFFPEGVVHSVMPYRKLAAAPEEFEGFGPKEDSDRVSEIVELDNSRKVLCREEGEGGNYIHGKLREEGM